MNIGYACTDCYITAHDSTHSNPYSEHNDTHMTNWVCTYGTLSENGCIDPEGGICSACDGGGTEYGITCGGVCDLGQHSMPGYWAYHVYSI